MSPPENKTTQAALLNASMLCSKIWALTWNLDITLAGQYKKFLGANNYGINARPVSDPREIAGRALLGRGAASVNDIMAATYGEWPVKGLDIVSGNTHRVKLESFFFRDIASAFSLNPMKRIIGRAALSAEGIYLNKFTTVFLPGLTGESGTNSFLGHEATHILQDLHNEQSHKMFGQDLADIIKNDPDSLQSIKVSERLFNRHTDPGQIANIQKNPFLQYFRLGHEIQARMTQILAEGYQFWGVMPRNREELTVAMIDMGLKAPADVVQALDQSPTIAKTREVFSSDAFKWHAQSIDINQALNTLTPEGKIEFWNDTLPKLYADLIEMQGDGPGRERFGLGKNPWPERRKQAGIPVRGLTSHEVATVVSEESRKPVFTANYGFEERQEPTSKSAQGAKTPPPALL